MSQYKNKTHENAAYAIKHNLKRLKKYHKDTPQTKNFNSYIKYHKDYKELESMVNQLISKLSYSDLRKTHDHIDFVSYFCKPKDHTFPNLYHYAGKEINKLYSSLVKRIISYLPEYEFNIIDNEGLICSSGMYKFKTPRQLHFFCRIDIDMYDIKLLYDGKEYNPNIKGDCEKFKLIENKYEQ